jgi:peptidoglycan lytic transglycosylase G
MNHWKSILLAMLAVLIVAAVFAGIAFNRFLNSPAAIVEEGLSFEISPGSSFQAVSSQLAAQGIIEHPSWLGWYARYTGGASKIRAGQYRLESGDTPAEILLRFVAGQVELFAFTIVEGWNYRELLAAMSASEVIQSSIVFEDWPAVLESIGASQQHPEGLFLPETYHFPKNTSEVEILRQAYQLMQRTLAEEWQGRDENLPLTSPYEALVLASIIEKETARADERAQIAGVFVRRLQKRMRLQTDPTVIYGIGTEFDGNITRRHLHTDTPYNTYTRHGLPPTPIAMPGRAAIHAALHPAPGNALYFVATGLGDGSHKFSATKAEHDAAVREYLARRRANRNKEQGT